MKITIRYTKDKDGGKQEIEEKNFYKVKRLLEEKGYKVEKV